MISLAFCSEKIQSARIKHPEIYEKDISITIQDDNCIECDDIVDPKTGNKENGYIFKDNAICKISLSNINALSKPIKITNYYYRDYDGYVIKILNEERNIESSSLYKIIPEHTYKYLNNANRLYDRIFVVECKYEVVNDELQKRISESTNNNIEQADFYIDDNGRCIEIKNMKIFFKLVEEKTFDEYVAKNKNSSTNVVKMK